MVMGKRRYRALGCVSCFVIVAFVFDVTGLLTFVFGRNSASIVT